MKVNFSAIMLMVWKNVPRFMFTHRFRPFLRHNGKQRMGANWHEITSKDCLLGLQGLF